MLAAQAFCHKEAMSRRRLWVNMLINTRGCTWFPQAVHTRSTGIGGIRRKTGQKRLGRVNEILGLT
jgi:hypothetical protein